VRWNLRHVERRETSLDLEEERNDE
jgi:hypothetical protein